LAFLTFSSSQPDNIYITPQSIRDITAITQIYLIKVTTISTNVFQTIVSAKSDLTSALVGFSILSSVHQGNQIQFISGAGTANDIFFNQNQNNKAIDNKNNKNIFFIIF
jgi:competence transcription factor ComK